MKSDPSEYLPTDDEIREAFSENGQANGKPSSKLELVNAASFMALDIPEPDQVIKGVLHQGSKFCIGGASKACKTWAMLDLALSVANGQPWMGFDTTRGRVLYLNFEIQNFAWQKRIRIVSENRKIDDLSNIELINLRGQTSDYAVFMPKLIETSKEEKFALVIIDPIYKLYGQSDENSARDVANLLNSIERLAVESNSAIAYASHFSKGNQSQKEALDRVSGSGVFARDPDCLLILTRHAEEDAFTVESILRNFAPVQPFVVRWKFPLLTRDETLDPEDLKKPGGRQVQFAPTELTDFLSNKSLSTSEWCKISMTELGMSRRTFFNSLKRLELEGLILKSKINQKWVLVQKVQ